MGRIPGIKEDEDEDIEAPDVLRGVDGEFLGVKGAILLKMNISGKEEIGHRLPETDMAV